MAAENNSVWFNSHKNIAIKEMRENKRSNKNTRCNRVRFKISTFLGLSISNNWGWAETLKNNFTFVEFGPLHKNELPSLSVTRVITH
jgi:hypothetical protein